MENNELKEKDYNILKRLLEVTKDVMSTYNDLYNLELLGRKDSLEYSSILESLKFYINMEDSIYEELNDNLKRIYDIQDYLFGEAIPDFDTELEYLKENNSDMLIKIRINGRLNEIIYSKDLEDDYDDEKEYEEYNDKDIEDFSEEDLEFLSELPSPDEMEQQMNDDATLEHSIEIDILNTILSILNKCLQDEKNNDIKDELIKLKYDIAFLYRKVETQLVNEYFIIPETLYWGSKLVADIQRRNNKEFLEFVDTYLDFISDNQAITMINLMEDETDLKAKRVELMISEIILRTCLLFSKKEEILSLRKRIKEEIIEMELKDELVENTINESFDSLKSDMCLPNIISLHPRLK